MMLGLHRLILLSSLASLSLAGAIEGELPIALS